MEKRCIIACKVLWREIDWLVSRAPLFHDVYYLEQGLHDEPQKLKDRLQEKISELENRYSVILIGYGLCSNGITGLRSKCSKLVIMRGHDCITFFLGSKERYRTLFDQYPGTYWYNTGWIETSDIPNKEFYDRKYLSYVEKYDEETAEYLVETEKEWLSKYNAIAYIRQDITDETEYIHFAEAAADYLAWNYKEVKGDLGLLKDWIEGNWDEERFLVIHPGETVTASFQENTIIRSENFTKPGMEENCAAYTKENV